MRRVLSCIQSTGEIHLGNYLGAIKNWVALQEKYECLYGVVDLHAMTVPFEPRILHENTINMLFDLLACGIDLKKSNLFVQSMIPEHLELFWIFNCLTPYGELSRMTQFKDKSIQQFQNHPNTIISSGLFCYPVLQAADILVYNADYVPVGKDQEQHLELARNIANRFNSRFKTFFKEPSALYTEVPKLMSLLDPSSKMSKSKGEKHYIGLFEDPDKINSKIKAAVTDSGRINNQSEISPGINNLFTILKSLGQIDRVNEFMDNFKTGTLKYSILKKVVADTIISLTESLRKNRKQLLEDKTTIIKQLSLSTENAREKAAATIKEVKSIIGIGAL